MLYRVLPYQIHKSVIAAYQRKISRIRLSIVLIALIIIFICVAAAYLSVLTHVRAEQQILKNTTAASEDRKQFEDVNKTTTNLVSALKGLKRPVSFVNILGKIIQAVPSGVSVSGFGFDESQKEKKTMRVVVRGIAQTRNDLQTFERTLRQEASFKQVDVPIDQLAKREDINFSITITLAI